MSDTPGLLEDIRVIDLTRILAGPYCTMMLGDLGADVIKIEAPEKGDDTRHWGPPFTKSGQSAYFISTNRNKRSITLNIKSDEGIEVLKDLISKGDVLVDNFRTGTLERIGLDYKTLQGINPELVYCTITGYGYTGPYKDKPGYDFMAQAIGGLMSITGPEDGEPVRVGIAVIDLVTGIYSSNAIVAALYAREKTGKGQRIDMSLLDSQVAFLSYAASNFLVSGENPKRYGNAHPNIVPYQSFLASDKHIAFAAGNDSQWKKFCTEIGREELIANQKFNTNKARVANREELILLLEEIFLTKTADEWIAICENIGIPAAPINSIQEVFADPQVVARERVTNIESAEDGLLPLLASPLNIPTNPPTIRRPPPKLGEHNEEILKKVLNYSDEKIRSVITSQEIK